VKAKVTASPRTIFDQSHYLKLIEARGETIRRVVNELKSALKLSTALDAGCGVGFFSEILRECGLEVRAFDGRQSNVDEATRRFPETPFEQGDIQSDAIRDLGQFDLVLCFGLLYHLESAFLAIRNLRSLTGRVLLLESMCFPDQEPWMLLREEPSVEDQSLTDVAFYATEGCLVKMLYRAGFQNVYRIAQLPDHDDFRDTPRHFRRRTVLLASSQPITLPDLIAMPEPSEASDPWQKPQDTSVPVHRRIMRFLSKPTGQKYLSVTNRVRRWFPNAPLLLRLPFGVWWLPKGSALDRQLLSGGFESSEAKFVGRFLRSGMTVLDIGAHHGFYTLLSSKLVGPKGRVFAFEPSARERKRLARHVALNRCSNVQIEPIAIGSCRSQADLFLVDGAEDYCNSLRPPIVEAKTHKIRVDVTSLDEFRSCAGIKTIDFVKIDVEGAELEVLKGARSVLTATPRPVMLVEVYDIRTGPWGYRAREIVSFLNQLGYRWFSLLADGTLQPVEPTLEVYDMNLVAIPKERPQEHSEGL
jgi:FkbM family methyltransferase